VHVAVRSTEGCHIDAGRSVDRQAASAKGTAKDAVARMPSAALRAGYPRTGERQVPTQRVPVKRRRFRVPAERAGEGAPQARVLSPATWPWFRFDAASPLLEPWRWHGQYRGQAGMVGRVLAGSGAVPDADALHEERL